MTYIKFENFTIKPGYIKADYQDQDKEHFIEFELSQDITVRDDLIAIALAALCGNKYKKVYMELTVSHKVKMSLEYALKAEIICKSRSREIVIQKPYDNHILNFSGGFDSISMLPFLPENTGLVSMDYGSHFSREMDVINVFTNYIVKTNILDTDFRSNSWIFMLIASILYSDLMSARYNIWGGVFGGSALSKKDFIQKYSTPYLLRANDMESIPYTLSITEAATAKIILQTQPDIIDASLKSLAPESSEKRFRKQMYVEIESFRNNLPVNLPNKLSRPSEHFSAWGESLHVDFMHLYFLKYQGMKETSKLLSGMPEQAEKLANSLSLKFYDKFNTNVLAHIPNQFKKQYIETLFHYGIEPYDERDWYELGLVRELLGKWHYIK